MGSKIAQLILIGHECTDYWCFNKNVGWNENGRDFCEESEHFSTHYDGSQWCSSVINGFEDLSVTVKIKVVGLRSLME